MQKATFRVSPLARLMAFHSRYNTMIFMVHGVRRARLRSGTMCYMEKRRETRNERGGRCTTDGRTSSPDGFEIELFILTTRRDATRRCDIGTGDRKIRGEPDGF